MSRARAAVLSVLVFAGLELAYLPGYPQSSGDTQWAIYTSMSLLEGKGGDLAEYRPLIDSAYAIIPVGGKYLNGFPIGVSLLSLPGVAVWSRMNPLRRQDMQREIPVYFEKELASTYVAITGVLFFWLVCGRFGSVRTALLSTLILGLGTSLWSTGARSLVQHGPMAMMLVIAMLIVVRGQRTPAIQYLSLPLAFAWIMRPTAVVPIVVLSAWVLFTHREWFVRYALWGIAVAVPWLIYSRVVWHTFVPLYYGAQRAGLSSTFGEALLGNLVSPSRGLFVYSPVLLLAFTGFALAWRNREERGIHVAFGLIVVLHLVLVSGFGHWWGGHAYGPRFMTDVMPFFVYYVAFNFEAVRTATLAKRRLFWSATSVLAAASVATHASGVLLPSNWTVVPVNIDEKPSRLWDWRDPQFARGPRVFRAMLRHQQVTWP